MALAVVRSGTELDDVVTMKLISPVDGSDFCVLAAKMTLRFQLWFGAVSLQPPTASDFRPLRSQYVRWLTASPSPDVRSSLNLQQ
jgi:hypothetical protein